MVEPVKVNVVEVHGIWDDEDEILKNTVAVWVIVLKGITELKKYVVEENVGNVTRSGKHYKPYFLEKDHPGRDIGERSKPMELKGEEDKVLTQLKKS